jgi:hypothetical protein
LDEGASLACSIYIDLAEIRAMLAATPETSVNTSAYYRILARLKRQMRQAAESDASQAAAASSASLDHQPDDNPWRLPSGSWRTRPVRSRRSRPQ